MSLPAVESRRQEPDINDMIGELNNKQIDQVLISQVVGRIGCNVDGRTYVVPVAYAFDGEYIYAHSRTGLKIQMMRRNPVVCFQVDIIESLGSWRSVILHGEYEELKTSVQQAEGLNLLAERLTPLVTSGAAMPARTPPPGEKKLRPIFFRILIREKSGRFERR